LPLFVDPANGDYRLDVNSQAVNKGNNDLAISAGLYAGSLDLAGNPRIYGDTIDVGAYEFQTMIVTETETPSTIVTTNIDKINPYDGLISIREALQYANTNDAYSVITFDKSLTGKTIKFNNGELVLDKTLTIDGSGVNIVIDANQQSRVFFVAQNANVTLVGLTITGDAASPTQFVNAPYGGGIFNQGALTILNSKITGNSARNGGGIFNADGTLRIVNCLLAGNVAQGSGGGLLNDARSDKANITNSTIANNTATDGVGGGICTTNVITINNAIVAENTSNNNYYHDIFGLVQGNNNLSSYSQWLNGSENNFVYDSSLPLFVGLLENETYDYHLAEYSQAIDRGNDALAVDAKGNLLVYDLAGNARIQGNAVDIGAYESPYRFPDAPVLGAIEEATTHDSVALEWTRQKDVTVYTLQYKTSGVDWIDVRLETLGNNVTSYTVTGLTPSTAYQFRLIAWYNGKKSEDSNEITAETKAAPTSLVVTTFDDSDNPNDNATSLREAIELVNTGQSEITFDASLFTDGTASIQLADELPTITTALTIDVPFENNAGKWGGAIYQLSGTLDATGGISLLRNEAQWGGGLYLNSGSADLTVAAGDFIPQELTTRFGQALAKNAGATMTINSRDAALIKYLNDFDEFIN
jgi:CSLREA domain-containing protein